MAATLNRHMDQQQTYGAIRAGGGGGHDDGGGMTRSSLSRGGVDVSWDDEVVPTLRKRLESESAFLSKRLSNPKPIPQLSPSSPSDYQAHQWHRPTPQQPSYHRSSEDYPSLPQPTAYSLARSPTSGSKIPVPSSSKPRGRRKEGSTTDDVFFPRSQEEETIGKYMNGEGGSGERTGSPSPASSRVREGPRTRTKSTPLAFSKQTGPSHESSTPPAAPPIPSIVSFSSSDRNLDLPPLGRSVGRTSSPTDHPLNTSSGSNSSSPSMSPKVRSVALPNQYPTRIPAPSRSRAGSVSSNTKLYTVSPPPPAPAALPPSSSYTSFYADHSPDLAIDDAWSETEVIRSDRMIRDEVAPFRILSPQLVGPAAGGRFELGKVDTFTERELLRQTGGARREMLEIAMKGHSGEVADGGGRKSEDVDMDREGDGGGASTHHYEMPSSSSPSNGSAAGRRRVTSTAGIGRSPSSSSPRNPSSTRQPPRTTTPQARKVSSPTPIASLEPPKNHIRTPRTSTTRPSPGARKVSTGPKSLPKSQSDRVRAPTPEDDEFGGYRMSMFGPDSVPPTSNEKGTSLNWDDNILPTVRKKMRTPNPLDQWEEQEAPSPLQKKSDRWANGSELPRLGNGRPVENGERGYGEAGMGKDGDENQDEAPPAPGTFDYDHSKRKPSDPSTPTRPQPAHLNASNRENDNLYPPLSNDASRQSSPTAFSAYRPQDYNGNGVPKGPIVQQPGRMANVDPLYPATPPLPSQQQDGTNTKYNKKQKNGGCCGCSIM